MWPPERTLNFSATPLSLSQIVPRPLGCHCSSHIFTSRANFALFCALSPCGRRRLQLLLPLNMLQHAATALQFVAACLAAVKRCTSAEGTRIPPNTAATAPLPPPCPIPFPNCIHLWPKSSLFCTHICAGQKHRMIFLFASSTSCKQKEIEKKTITKQNNVKYINFDLPLVRLLH